MSNINDFVIEDGILTKYVGKETEVVIPEGVTEIGLRAFAGCEKLKKVTIPETVTKVGSEAFKNCKQLPVEFRIYNYTARKGVIFNYDDMETPIVNGIDKGEIYNSLKDFRVIEEDKHFYLGNDNNPYLVFCGHRDAENRKRCKITINPRTRYIDVLYSIKFPKAHCILEFYLMDELVWLNESFKVLSADLKQKCVESFLRLYNDGKEIEKSVVDAYKKYIVSQRKKYYTIVHTNLAMLRFMTSNDIIEKAVCGKIFEEVQKTKNAEAIATMLAYMEKQGIVAEQKDKSASKLDLDAPEGIVLTPEEAKLDWMYSSVELDDGTKGIAIDSYKGMDTIVTIPSKIGKKTVLYINAWAFSPKKERLTAQAKRERLSIKEVVIPEGVVGLEYDAFNGSNVETVRLPSSLKEIGNGAFASCEKLKEIKIPEGCVFGGSFVGCKLLENSSKMVVINGKLDSCSSTKKTSIQIPKTVTEICKYAFYECENLKELVFHKNVKKASSCITSNWWSKPITLTRDGGKKTLVIVAPAGSFGIEYAKENGLEFKEI